MNKDLNKLQKGCGKDFCKRNCVIENYDKRKSEHIKCGEAFPKGYTDKRMDLNKYPVFLCYECKKKINRIWKKNPIQKFSNLPLVQVKWLDAQTGFSQLMPISEFKRDFKPYYNYSFGYLLEDNKDHIILGFLLMDSEVVDEETGVKHWQLIPRGMVKETTYFSSKTEDKNGK